MTTKSALLCLPLILILGCGEKKPTQSAAPAAPSATLNLIGTDWLLDDLAGTGVLDRVPASLTFPEEGKTAGNGSCNRFSGSVEISATTIKFGPLATTRMACPETIMNQETKYLQLLQSAERYAWQDPYLLVFSTGQDKPLRFTRTQKSTLLPHS